MRTKTARETTPSLFGPYLSDLSPTKRERRTDCTATFWKEKKRIWSRELINEGFATWSLLPMRTKWVTYFRFFDWRPLTCDSDICFSRRKWTSNFAANIFWRKPLFAWLFMKPHMIIEEFENVIMINIDANKNCLTTHQPRILQFFNNIKMKPKTKLDREIP